jgi:hypothetical protein
MFASKWLAKISYVSKQGKLTPFLFNGIGPIHRAHIGIHMIQFSLSLGGFAHSAAISLLKNKHYFTSSFIFLSPGYDSVTAIAGASAKRGTHPPACHCPQLHASLSLRSKMPLSPPMPQPLLFGHGNPSSSHHPLLPQLSAAVLFLLLLPATACLYRSCQWLAVASFPEKICPSGGSIGRRFGVDSESVSDLSRRIGVLEMAEYWEKVQPTSARPHVDLVLGGNGTGTRLMRADT